MEWNIWMESQQGISRHAAVTPKKKQTDKMARRVSSKLVRSLKVVRMGEQKHKKKILRYVYNYHLRVKSITRAHSVSPRNQESQ